jgi:hypothetical protein
MWQVLMLIRDCWRVAMWAFQPNWCTWHFDADALTDAVSALSVVHGQRSQNNPS